MSEVTITNNSAVAATITNDGLNTGDVAFGTKGAKFGDPTESGTSGTTSDVFGSPGLSLSKESSSEVTITNDSIT